MPREAAYSPLPAHVIDDQGLVLEAGARVVLLTETRAGVVPGDVGGIVELIDAESDTSRVWIYWRDHRGGRHASPAGAVRVDRFSLSPMGPTEASIAIRSIQQIMENR